MNNASFRCRCCGKIKKRRSPEQRFCGEAACQRVRKQAWRRSKYASDPDYRLNQKQSTSAWLQKQGGAAAYFKNYRRQRREQGQRKPPKPESTTNAGRALSDASANSDAKLDDSLILSGKYRLTPLYGANSDAIAVKLSIIPADLMGLQISTP